ncbi:hypothetical protein BRADI_2g27916v3, partial [Brachypodium distachyon]
MRFMVSSVSFTFCSWNVRGLGDNKKCANVLSELLSLNPSAVLIQESKLSDITPFKAYSFLPRSLDHFNFKAAVGSAGGMVSAFSSSHFNISQSTQQSYCLSNFVDTLADPSPIKITNVYVPTDHSLKDDFLLALTNDAPDAQTPWIIMGDFNLLRSHEDKNSGSFRQAEADKFNDTINALALLELPLLDRRFTWTNNRESPILEKIDRVFINNAWNTCFPNFNLSSLTRFTSDH